MDDCIVMLLKDPRAGSVKTRLAADIGDERAAILYSAFVLDTLDTLQRLPSSLRLHFDPPSSHTNLREWLGDNMVMVPQEGTDLGDRLRNAFLATFREGFRSAIVVGSDSPDLPLRVLEDAFAALKGHGAVIGPSRDGGYYLIGFRRDAFLPDAFSGIPWSTPDVFRKTLERFLPATHRPHILPTWEDIDTVDDLRRFFGRTSKEQQTAARTLDLIRRLLSEGALSSERRATP